MNPLARMVRALHDRLTRGGTQARRQIRALGLHERALRDIIRSLEIARGHLSDRVNESMATTESEVLAAGGAITRVVAHARSQAAALAALARALSSSASGETSVETSVVMQLETVRSLINSLQAQARSQSARSEASAECVDLIVGVSHKIDMLSLETNILSLNASIEASRDEPSAHAFGVVADEMRRLSREIATANAEVHELGERLAQLLPAIASGARAIAEEADTFASLSASRGETVKTAIATLNSRVGASIEASAATVRDVIGAAQEAVSHLQFQDVTAQALRCGDAILHEAYTRVLASMGAEERAQGLAEPVYRTLGTANDPTVAVASVDAGEVTLF